MMLWLVIANVGVFLLVALLTFLGFRVGKGGGARWLLWAMAVLFLLMQAGCWITAMQIGSGLQ